ncbi:hypothetical protein BsWGS_10348 [Bradybaena similaris]
MFAESFQKSAIDKTRALVMQQLFTVFSCLLAVAVAHYNHNHHVPNSGAGDVSLAASNANVALGDVASKRQATEETSATSATSQDLYQLTNETLENATKGISAEDLKNRAEAIQILCGAILNDRNVNVSNDVVRNQVDKLAVKLGVQISLADILFDGSLTEAENKVGTIFLLLQRLREDGIFLEAAGESTDVILQTIFALAEVLESEVNKIDGIVKFAAAFDQENDDQENDETRRGVEKGK